MTAGMRAVVKRCMKTLGVSPNAVPALKTARQLGVRGITGRLKRTVQKRMRHETFRFDIEGNDQDEPTDTAVKRQPEGLAGI